MSGCIAPASPSITRKPPPMNTLRNPSSARSIRNSAHLEGGEYVKGFTRLGKMWRSKIWSGRAPPIG